MILGILLLPGLGAIISFLIGKKSEKIRDIFNIVLTGIIFLLVTFLYYQVSQRVTQIYIPHIMGIGLYLKLDMFRYIFIWITAFVWFLSTLFSVKYLLKYKNRNRYYAIFMLTLFGTIGIFLSENLLNLFTFFEIMSLVSYTLVIHDEDKYTHEAGKTYLIMSLAGGLILLLGVFLIYDYTSTLNINQLSFIIPSMGNVKYIICIPFIVGFGIKASMVPFHIWLPKAYPAAPAPATAVLSAILAKTGVFGIIIIVNIIMKGDIIISFIIMILGLINMFLGGLLAIFQRNIKRILAYSSMSQMGYILMGIGLTGIIGEHGGIAINGALYHIINHAVYKSLLFLATGVMYIYMHELSINEIRGFGTQKRLFKILFLIGIFGVIGVPGFNGYASKILLHEAIIEAHHIYKSSWFTFVEIVYIISSSFTVAYLFKIFAAVFVRKNFNFKRIKYFQKHTLYPLVILSLLIILIGINPHFLLNLINRTLFLFNIHTNIEIKFYTTKNIISVLIPILLGIVIYNILVRKYLVKKIKGQIKYINPSLNWLNAERDVYIPVFNFIYDLLLIILWYIDIAILNSIEKISQGINVVTKIKLNPNKTVKLKELKELKKLKKNKIIKFSFIKKFNYNINIPKYEKIIYIVNKLRSHLNGIMYSIFIFALMLVFILVGMFK